ncbi:unnamed protein product [Urochloa decumbens]|uniref:F-box protein AT5G49610-like beta-propeller domain-containing protein n=1 Tax=Urochloa decumbens TaxID=240449 RepID=A0ABC9GIZ3_9POAL
MLGFFAARAREPLFIPTLSPPDRIPPARFSLPQRLSNSWKFLGCRHGFVACLDLNRMEALVWKPVTGSHHHIPFPPEFHQNKCNYNGAVLSSAASDSHVRHSSAFKLVLAHIGSDYKAVSVCLYESESGKWGKISSTSLTCVSLFYRPAVMVGNAVYWFLHFSNSILQFDLDGQSLAIIKTPEDTHVTGYSHIHAVPHDNKLGLAILSKLSIQFWESEADLDGVNRWVLRQTVKLHNLLSLSMDIRATWQTVISGFDEDNNSIFLSLPPIGVIMIQLETMQCLKLLEGRYMDICYPYTSLYTAGLGIDGGDDKAEMLNST